MDLLRGVVDPELGADIVELGMARGVQVHENGHVQVEIALTTAGCPLRAQIQKDVRARIVSLPGVTRVTIDWGELNPDEKARAMERAGNRLKSLSRDKPNGVAGKDMHLMIQPFPDRVDDLLKDAWDRSLVAHVEHDGVDSMIEAADAYCRTILTSREAFSAKTLQAELRKARG